MRDRQKIDYENIMCQAIQMISQSNVNQNKFDYTIQALVLGYVDTQTKNMYSKKQSDQLSIVKRYRLRYQELVFDCEPLSTTYKYPIGSQVYVLIPQGDFKGDKILLGAVVGQSDQIITDESISDQQIDRLCRLIQGGDDKDGGQ